MSWGLGGGWITKGYKVPIILFLFIDIVLYSIEWTLFIILISHIALFSQTPGKSTACWAKSVLLTLCEGSLRWSVDPCPCTNRASNVVRFSMTWRHHGYWDQYFVRNKFWPGTIPPAGCKPSGPWQSRNRIMKRPFESRLPYYTFTLVARCAI